MPDHEVRQPSELQPFLDLVKEEYRTLRDESKQATINMLAAIQVGASVIGALMYAGFSQWNTSPSVVRSARSRSPAPLTTPPRSDAHHRVVPI